MKTSKWIGLFGLVALGSLFAAGCGGSAAGSGDCEKYCAKREQCDSDTDESECVETCQGQTGFNPSYVAANDRCVNDLSCDELASDEYGDCIDDGTRDVEPSPTVIDFCKDAAAFAENCDAKTDEEDAAGECEKAFVVFADVVANDVRKCLDETCDEAGDCIADVMKKYNLGDDKD